MVNMGWGGDWVESNYYLLNIQFYSLVEWWGRGDLEDFKAYSCFNTRAIYELLRP